MTGPVTTEALVEDGCRAVYGKNWDGPPDKAPGEAMRKVWRDLVAKAQAPLLAALQQQAASIGSLEESVNGLEAAHQQVTAERDEARNPFGNFTPTVERIALLMGRVWLEAKGAAGDTVADFEEFAMLAPEDCADCCTVAKAVLAAVDPAKANERADAAEASLATATSELARLRAEGEGTVAVPLEPTVGMQEDGLAALEAAIRTHGKPSLPGFAAAHVYRAMVAARPSTAKEDQADA